MEIWQAIEGKKWNADHLQQAASLLQNGGLVAFPTETVYGLGANALLQDAVLKIFAAKHRPADNPLIVHIADREQLSQVVAGEVDIPMPAKRAMDLFWPGPLTLLFPAGENLASAVHPDLEKVGVRMPQHPIALDLIRAAGCPVAAPSANKSGRPSPTSAQDVMDDFEGTIDGLVDGGSCQMGLESSVVEIFADHAVIYRPGYVTREQLEEALEIPVVYAENLSVDETGNPPKSPGTKYRHYAPEAKVHVWWGDAGQVLVALMQFIDHHDGISIGVISKRDFSGRVKSWTPPEGVPYAEAVSRELYRLLRDFDKAGVAHVLVEGVPPTGVGAALMNRLAKASEGRVHEV